MNNIGLILWLTAVIVVGCVGYVHDKAEKLLHRMW